MSHFIDANDAVDGSNALSELASRIGKRRKELRMDVEIEIWRKLVERAIEAHEAQTTAYQTLAQSEPHMMAHCPQPSQNEIRLSLEGLRKHQEAAARIEYADAVPKEVVQALVSRITSLIRAHVPEMERQRALLRSIAAIELR